MKPKEVRKFLMHLVETPLVDPEVEGMRHLLMDTFNSSRGAKLVGNTALVDAVILQTQEKMRKYYQERGINPRLKLEAIEEFLAPYTPDYVPPIPPPPAPFDKTHAMSGHGRQWGDFAACNGQDTELFFPVGQESAKPSAKQVKQAKAICARCVVKGDCLNFALDNASSGIAGGFTESERRALDNRARQWLKLSDPRKK